MRAARLRGRSGVSQLVIRCTALLVVLLAAALGAAAPAGARVMQTGIADDAVLLDGGAEADHGGRAVARHGRRRRPRPGVVGAHRAGRPVGGAAARASRPPTRTTRTTGGASSTRAVARLVARGHQADADDRRAAAAVGLGRTRPRQPALPPERARVRELRVGRRPALRRRRSTQYILWNEPNLPLWMQPQADCGKKRCTPVSPEPLPLHGPRRVSGDPRGRPGRPGPDRRARPGRRRPQEREREHAPARVPARPGLPRRQARRRHDRRAAARSAPRSPTASPTTRTARATRRASPTRTPTTPTSAA